MVFMMITALFLYKFNYLFVLLHILHTLLVRFPFGKKWNTDPSKAGHSDTD